MKRQYRAFGKRIRKLRIADDYSLRQFGELVGMSQGYISLIETGKIKPPSDEKIKQLADVLGVGRDELFYLSGRLPEDVRKIAENKAEEVSKMVRKKFI